jgi:hypothetical protein
MITETQVLFPALGLDLDELSRFLKTEKPNEGKRAGRAKE